MGYYVANMFGIRTGGVFSGETDTEDMRYRINHLVKTQREIADNSKDILPWDLGGESCDINHCMSKELEAHKGSMVVIGGIFNYWTFDKSSDFACALSKEFETEVMHMCLDLEMNQVRCQVWLAGKPLYEISENPIGKILRHVT